MKDEGLRLVRIADGGQPRVSGHRLVGSVEDLDVVARVSRPEALRDPSGHGPFVEGRPEKDEFQPRTATAVQEYYTRQRVVRLPCCGPAGPIPGGLAPLSFPSFSLSHFPIPRVLHPSQQTYRIVLDGGIQVQ